MGACKASPARMRPRRWRRDFAQIRPLAGCSCATVSPAAFLKDRRESLIEVCAGRLDGEDAETRIVKEAEEETGFVVRHPRRVFEAYMSSWMLWQKLTFFVARSTAGTKARAAGSQAKARILKSWNYRSTKRWP